MSKGHRGPLGIDEPRHAHHLPIGVASAATRKREKGIEWADFRLFQHAFPPAGFEWAPPLPAKKAEIVPSGNLRFGSPLFQIDFSVEGFSLPFRGGIGPRGALAGRCGGAAVIGLPAAAIAPA